tara:strand:- start:2423 stop:3313 length:891 start_codon:yes stop_codon:yes gene_type:complete
MRKKILVAGGTGFLGINLIKVLVKNKYQVTSLSSKKINKTKKIKKVRYIHCDISNYKKLKKKINNNFNIVINLSGNIDHNNKKQTRKTHFKGTKNLINIINKSNLKIFIQIGSCLEYGRLPSPQQEIKNPKPISYYGKAKYEASKFLIKSNIKNYIILRLYQVYGPYQKKDRLIPQVIDSCLKNKKFSCSEGYQLRDFIYVNDFVQLIIKILGFNKFSSGVYNIGSGNPISVKKIINMIVKKIKKGKPEFGKIEMRKDEIVNLYPKLKKVRKELKWKSKISLSEGLKKTINFYAKN